MANPLHQLPVTLTRDTLHLLQQVILPFAWVKRVFSRQIASSASDENWQQSPLSNLSSELLLLITAFLDASDAACLALTHRALAAKLGSHSWNTLLTTDADDIQREVFLNRLAQDLPDFWCCQPCLRLHRKALVPPCVTLQGGSLHCMTRKHRILLGSHGNCGHQDMSRYALRFPHVHLAMKRHRNGGNHGIPVESLAVTEVQTYSGNETESNIITLLSVEPSIIFDEMYLRVQHWALFPLSNPPQLKKPLFIHLCNNESRCRSLFSNIMDLYEGAYHESDIPSSCRIFHCLTCSADFEVEVRYFENGSTALIITKWLNLGSGESPKHDKWLRNITFRVLLEQSEGKAESGTVRKTFEQHGTLSQEDLTTENEVLLLTEQFYNFPQIEAYISSFRNWIKPNKYRIEG